MDGVGKSTVAKQIAERHHLQYIEKPMTEIFDTALCDGKDTLNAVSRNIYDLDTSILKAWFFGLGNLYVFDKYRNKDLIIDRHFASNYFWNGNEQSDIIFRTMKELVGVPDVTILLYASPETRMQRLYLRNPNDYDLTDTEKHVDGYDKMLSFVKKFEIPYVFVDTENKTVDDVVDEVSDVVDSVKKGIIPPQKVKLPC